MTNVLVRDLDLVAPNPLDSRRLEVVVDGLPLFGGCQLAVDTTLVCALHCDGSPHGAVADADGVVLQAARRWKERTYPELVGPRSRARLVVLAWKWVAVGLLRAGRLCCSWPEPERGTRQRSCRSAWSRRGACVGCHVVVRRGEGSRNIVLGLRVHMVLTATRLPFGRLRVTTGTPAWLHERVL